MRADLRLGANLETSRGGVQRFERSTALMSWADDAAASSVSVHRAPKPGADGRRRLRHIRTLGSSVIGVVRVVGFVAVLGFVTVLGFLGTLAFFGDGVLGPPDHQVTTREMWSSLSNSISTTSESVLM